MFLSKRFNLGLVLILFCILLSACGPSPEELAAASAAETASAATSTSTTTPIPTNTTLPPTRTSTLIPPTKTSTPTMEPMPGAIPKGIIVTYTGRKCVYTDPTEIPPGEYTFVLRDQKNEKQIVYVGYLLEGKTYDEVVERQKEPGRYFPLFSWVEQANLIGNVKNEGRNEKYYTFSLEEGEYIVYLYSYSTTDLWLCAPLRVVD